MKLPEKVSNALNGRVGTAIEATLNVIPYAGGTLATVFGNYLGDRKLLKITEALDELATKVKINEIIIDQLLTEDQAGELLEKHLIEIAVTSNADKLRFLKNSLNQSFTEANFGFAEKELFMNTIKGLTEGEILMLNMIYRDTDPFVDKIYPNNSESFSTQFDGSLSGVLTNQIIFSQPQYTEGESFYKEGNITFEEHMRKKHSDKWPFMKAASIQLDGKGLSNIKENLFNKIRKEIKMIPTILTGTLNQSAYYQNMFGGSRLLHSVTTHTPFEGSKTEFGKSLIKYVLT